MADSARNLSTSVSRASSDKGAVENARLRQRIRELEEEVSALKRTVFRLTTLNEAPAPPLDAAEIVNGFSKAPAAGLSHNSPVVQSALQGPVISGKHSAAPSPANSAAILRAEGAHNNNNGESHGPRTTPSPKEHVLDPSEAANAFADSVTNDRHHVEGVALAGSEVAAKLWTEKDSIVHEASHQFLVACGKSHAPSTQVTGNPTSQRFLLGASFGSKQGSSTNGLAGNSFVGFVERASLKPHNAASYAVRFAPDGSMLVSTSFDRSIVLWSMDNYISATNAKPRLMISDAHRAAIIAVEWLSDCTGFITGAFDASAAEWNVASGQSSAVSRYHARGLVSAIAMSPSDRNIFFAATSKAAVHLFDRRIPSWPTMQSSSNHRRLSNQSRQLSPASRGAYDESTIIVENDAGINTIYAYLDGTRILTGDQKGAVKTWDLRVLGEGGSKSPAVSSRVDRHSSLGLLDVMYNDPAHRPITHVHCSPPLLGEDNGRLLAVNSYDNYLRVYDRGASLFESNTAELKSMHTLRGVVNRNWPIRSSFFAGKDYQPRRGDGRHRPRDRVSSGTANCGAGGSGVRGGVPIGSGLQDDVHVLSRSRASGISPSSFLGTPVAPIVGVLDDSGEGRHRLGDPRNNSHRNSSESELESDSADDHAGDVDGAFDSTSSDEEEEERRREHPPRDERRRLSRLPPYRACEMPVQQALILASGSADGNIYMYDVGGERGTGGLVQKISAHRDRVHAVDFHPTEPILASCSADAEVKIWAPPSRVG